MKGLRPRPVQEPGTGRRFDDLCRRATAKAMAERVRGYTEWAVLLSGIGVNVQNIDVKAEASDVQIKFEVDDRIARSGLASLPTWIGPPSSRSPSAPPSSGTAAPGPAPVDRRSSTIRSCERSGPRARASRSPCLAATTPRRRRARAARGAPTRPATPPATATCQAAGGSATVATPDAPSQARRPARRGGLARVAGHRGPRRRRQAGDDRGARVARVVVWGSDGAYK